MQEFTWFAYHPDQFLYTDHGPSVQFFYTDREPSANSIFLYRLGIKESKNQRIKESKNPWWWCWYDNDKFDSLILWFFDSLIRWFFDSLNHSFLLVQSVPGPRYSSTRWFYAGIHMVCVSSRSVFGIDPSLSFIEPFPNPLINLMGVCSFYAGIHMVCLSSRSAFGIKTSLSFIEPFSKPLIHLMGVW